MSATAPGRGVNLNRFETASGAAGPFQAPAGGSVSPAAVVVFNADSALMMTRDFSACLRPDRRALSLSDRKPVKKIQYFSYIK